MIVPRRALRALAPCAGLAMVLVVAPSCGDDTDGDAASGQSATGFCEGIVEVDDAFRSMPESESEGEAFYRDRIVPAVERMSTDVPDRIEADVQVMTEAVDGFGETGDFAVFQSPAFLDASTSVYESLDDTCDIPVVDVEAVDYDYEQVPDTLDAGATAFVMDNTSEAGEAHELSLVKLRSDADVTLDELFAMPESEADAYVESFAGGVFAPAGASAGTVIELTPGRWVYACFIPVGSVDGSEGTGPPHLVEGMAGEFTVEGASS